MSYTTLLLLSAVSYTSADLWTVDIDNGPAPSPEDGPPFSAHASRNRALLPYQIIGIVGAYLGFVLMLGTLLFTTGRKLRRHALKMAERPVELVKPIMRVFDGQSPATSERKTPFSRLRKQKSLASSIRSSNVGSPMDSVVHFDPNVIQQNRKRDQDELANYYAAVYDAEEQIMQKVPGSAIELQEVPIISVPQHPHKKPPLRMDTSATQYTTDYPASPRTPRSPSVRAIYPPLAYNNAAQNLQEQSQSPKAYRDDSSFATHLQNPSSPSQSMRGRLARERLRKSLKISAPIRDDNSDGARTPLSPRIYVDPGVPPEPPSAITVDSRHYYPASPQTMQSWREDDEYEYREDMDAVRALPREYPQRGEMPNGLSLNTSQPLVVPSRKQTVSPSNKSASGDGSLPFRQYNARQNISQSSVGPTRVQQPLGSPGLLSPPIQHHVLSVSQDRFGYEAGMLPWTPRTPVFTPHLTTRAERLQKQKEEKALKGAITEEDQVKDESEMWNDAY